MFNEIKTMTNEEIREWEKIGYVKDLKPVAELKIQELKEDSVIVVQADTDKVNFGMVAKIMDNVKNTFPNNQLVFLPTGMSIGVLDKAKSIDLLEQILAELKK